MNGPARRRFARMLGRRMLALLGLSLPGVLRAAAQDRESHRRLIARAFEMKRLALSWGDQPYGAVVERNGQVVGEGPSRVIQNNDMDAHAEREAIRDAQRRLGSEHLSGAVLYSTSRPCWRCEGVAAKAGIERMYFGMDADDAGPPRI